MIAQLPDDCPTGTCRVSSISRSVAVTVRCSRVTLISTFARMGIVFLVSTAAITDFSAAFSDPLGRLTVAAAVF